MLQEPDPFAAAVDRLRRMCDRAHRDFDAIERTVMVRDPDEQAIETWRVAGATRLVVAPWPRSAEAVDGLTAFRPVQ